MLTFPAAKASGAWLDRGTVPPVALSFFCASPADFRLDGNLRGVAHDSSLQ